MSVLVRERRWGVGLSAALHLLALCIFLFLPPHRILPPAVPRPTLSLRLDPIVPPPEQVPLQRQEPNAAKKPKIDQAASLRETPKIASISPRTVEAPPTPRVWSPAAESGFRSLPDIGVGNGKGDGTDGNGAKDGTGDGGGEPSPRPEGPQWIRRPTEAEMLNTIPPEAFRQRSGGGAVLSCLVKANNRVHRCKVLSDRPEGLGFGLAAQRLSRLFLIKPPERDGEPRYDIPVQIPVVWDRI